ncbi:MAG: beta-galactosidase [Verrucomicrobiota bacterium]
MLSNSTTITWRQTAVAIFVAVSSLATAAPVEKATTLFDFTTKTDVSGISTTDATVAWKAGQGLVVQTGQKNSWPGITLKAPNGKWDLSACQAVSVELKNTGTEKVTISCRVDNQGADGNKNCITTGLALEPGASGTLRASLNSTPWRLSENIKIIGMRGAPGRSDKLDPAAVTQLLLFIGKPTAKHSFEVTRISGTGSLTTLDIKTFFPFIDEFGQFKHIDWPGKTHSLEDMAAKRQAEVKELAAQPGPKDRDQYGGWTAGPTLKATGFFRVEKHQGKWWLVDPEGRLFWSHGVDCVRLEASTPISDRENYYQNLPAEGSPFAKFYGTGNFAAHDYYEKIPKYRTYDFSKANLLRKYGETYPDQFADMTHRRLRSWGMNTIANWSDSKVYNQRRTPYTATIGFGSKSIQGSSGYWRKFFDVFDTSFRDNARKAMEKEKDTSANDPWCIGYYVHNEESWGSETSLASAALSSPPDQPAKLVFVEDLKKKYTTIAALNQAWGVSHASWDTLLQSTNTPSVKLAGDDLRAFYQKLAETYFQIVKEEIKRAAPNHLYLGCRFAWVNDIAARAATKHCDVISYNRYEYSVEKHHLPDSIDLPMIIGEFHFGALDRGMFHTGLKRTENQNDRALKYKEYVQGALRNPYFVGTHWFQYKDQATTGRSDGENYQIGFLDICDNPYPETIQASREVGYGMYEYRLKNN